jgi:hypothetical protein
MDMIFLQRIPVILSWAGRSKDSIYPTRLDFVLEWKEKVAWLDWVLGYMSLLLPFTLASGIIPTTITMGHAFGWRSGM